MKIKVVLRALFLAYGLTGICLLALAFFVFQFDLGTVLVFQLRLQQYMFWLALQEGLWQENA